DRVAPDHPHHEADAGEEHAGLHGSRGEAVPVGLLPEQPGDRGERRDQEGEHAEPHRRDMDVEEPEPDPLEGVFGGGEGHPQADRHGQTREGEPDSDAGHVLDSSKGPATATPTTVSAMSEARSSSDQARIPVPRSIAATVWAAPMTRGSDRGATISEASAPRLLKPEETSPARVARAAMP